MNVNQWQQLEPLIYPEWTYFQSNRCILYKLPDELEEVVRNFCSDGCMEYKGPRIFLEKTVDKRGGEKSARIVPIIHVAFTEGSEEQSLLTLLRKCKEFTAAAFREPGVLNVCVWLPEKKYLATVLASGKDMDLPYKDCDEADKMKYGNLWFPRLGKGEVIVSMDPLQGKSK